MGKIVGLVNQKGGAGKSSITNALSNEFARRGYRVLVVDYDHREPRQCYSVTTDFHSL